MNVCLLAAIPCLASFLPPFFRLLQDEVNAWTEAICNSTAAALNDMKSSRSTSRANISLVPAGEAISEIRSLADNALCADCGRRNPDWASINLGVMICIDCSGTHRSMGVDISKVRGGPKFFFNLFLAFVLSLPPLPPLPALNARFQHSPFIPS